MDEVRIIVASGTDKGKTAIATAISWHLAKLGFPITITDDTSFQKALVNNDKAVKALLEKPTAIVVETRQLNREGQLTAQVLGKPAVILHVKKKG